MVNKWVLSTSQGKRLNDACHDGDVTIMLGDKNCALLSRTQDSISCDPGEDFPGTARTVQVKVRRNKHKNQNFLSYERTN